MVDVDAFQFIVPIPFQKIAPPSDLSHLSDRQSRSGIMIQSAMQKITETAKMDKIA
jgi:hypothetical protein